MPIILDHRMREHIVHHHEAFPITLFYDELALLPNHAGPLHWHTDFEIATAIRGVLDFQIGTQHVTLHAGESIFINVNVLHAIRQVSDGEPDPAPNIVFSGKTVASENSVIYSKYIEKLALCESLPYIAFGNELPWHREVNRLIRTVYKLMQEKGACYEMGIQRRLNSIFEHIVTHLEELPRFCATRIQINSQIRIHKMLSYIYDHYKEPLTLKNIAAAANVSVSEAGRCFHSYIGHSPISVLIQRRLQEARRLLDDTTKTVQEISESCGFNSVQYFSRQFRKFYGHSPRQKRNMGK